MELFKAFLLIFFTFCATFSVVAQKAISYAYPDSKENISQTSEKTHISKKSIKSSSSNSFSFDGIWQEMQDRDIFQHLDIAATVGSTGIGIDLASPIGEYVQLRAGFSIMPRFEMTSGFRVQVGDSLDKKWDEHGNRLQTKFDKLSGYLKSFVGYDVDDEVEMLCKPTYYNFKVLVDVFPFPDKRWHVTAGFYAGPSEIVRAYNKTEEMPTLLSVTMWNTMYEKAYNLEPIYDSYYMPVALENKLLSYGRMGFHAGDFVHDAKDVNGKEYKAGDPYMMEPDAKNGMVKAFIKVNRFKPYLGFGFGGAVSKDQKTMLSFDAGAMFWGGTPAMVTHEGINLTKDVENVSGKLGRYVDAAKVFKVFPVLEFRISRRIF